MSDKLTYAYVLDEPLRYFVVVQDELSSYGDQDGMTKEELEKYIKENPLPTDENLVIIKGMIIKPKWVIE